jgi:hypothetical protein
LGARTSLLFSVALVSCKHDAASAMERSADANAAVARFSVNMFVWPDPTRCPSGSPRRPPMDLEAKDDDLSCYFSVRFVTTYDRRAAQPGMPTHDFFSGGEWVDGVSDVLWYP